MSLMSLRAKGVEPTSSYIAQLKCWRLRFNVQHFFRALEGGVANIEHTGNPEDVVYGVLHECPDNTLAELDATEAYGYGYDRITIDVTVRDQNVQAFAYIGLPEFIDNRCKPSQRYLNILISGAQQAQLDSRYIEALKSHPIHVPDSYPNYVHPDGDFPRFDEQTLSLHPSYTAIDGAVFDMAESSPLHQHLMHFFGGRDMTLFHLKRMDTSDGTETLDDIKLRRYSQAQTLYLNTFLIEYDKEYRYVGRYSYNDIE